jgi:hypothetical protein
MFPGPHLNHSFLVLQALCTEHNRFIGRSFPLLSDVRFRFCEEPRASERGILAFSRKYQVIYAEKRSRREPKERSKKG